jgi:hypothetical protein
LMTLMGFFSRLVGNQSSLIFIPCAMSSISIMLISHD